MARPDPFDGLTEFLAIARQGSFRAAAAELGVSPGAVSQALKALERRLGVPLFARTTRCIALTEAGRRLIARLMPASDAIAASLADIAGLGERPSGMLRLLVHHLALAEVIAEVWPAFRAAYPEIHLDVVVDNIAIDLISGGFDAGIRVGEFIDRDMLAVRVSPPFGWVVAGSPAYLAAHGRPETPEDLAGHHCLRYRFPGTGEVYRWEFERDGTALSIDPPGMITVSDSPALRDLATRGHGLIYTSTLHARTEFADGRLLPLLEAFSPARDALYVCYPRSGRDQPKLRAFVDVCLARMRGAESSAKAGRR